MKIALTISGVVWPSTMTFSSATTDARLWCSGQPGRRSKSCASSSRTACRSACTSGSSLGARWSRQSSYQNIETPSKVGAGSIPYASGRRQMLDVAPQVLRVGEQRPVALAPVVVKLRQRALARMHLCWRENFVHATSGRAIGKLPRIVNDPHSKRDRRRRGVCRRGQACVAPASDSGASRSSVTLVCWRRTTSRPAPA